MGNAMSAMSSEERQAVREGRLFDVSDYLVEVSRKDLETVLGYALADGSQAARRIIRQLERKFPSDPLSIRK